MHSEKKFMHFKIGQQSVEQIHKRSHPIADLAEFESQFRGSTGSNKVL